MTVGERIKRRRLELNLSQEQLAKRMGYSNKAVICKVEKSSDLNFTTERVSKFATALGVTEAYLMGWEEARFDKNSANILADAMKDERLILALEMMESLDNGKRDDVLKYIRFISQN